MPQPVDAKTGQAINLTADPAKQGTYILEQREWGKHYIGPAQNVSAMLCGTTSPVKTALLSAEGVQWYLEPCTTTSVTLNSAGITGLYVDFAIQLPEGLKAYAVNHVTSD